MIRRIAKYLGGSIAILLSVVGCQMVRNSGDVAIPAPTNGALRISTYNVHYIIMRKETGPWSRGDWDRRKGPLDLAFKEINADVIAFQEMESFAHGQEGRDNLALDWLLANNPGYRAAAVGDPAKFPSTQPIFYRKNRLSMLDQGWFFFSETPDKIYSRTFNGSYPAFASWATFRDLRNGEEFKVVNIHTDFRNRKNRLRSALLVADRVKPWAQTGETVFVAGDMNARHGDGVINIFTDAGVSFAPVKGATYHLNRGLNLFSAVDHIGVIGKAAVIGEPVVLRKQFGGEWPTDHYPVIVDYHY